jgi:regulation of enolase protein 1 (concanavalin A-like superfamily)
MPRKRVKVITNQNNIPKIIGSLDELNEYSVEIGVFASDDSFYAMLANVHEFGITIRAKGKVLTIPTKEAKGRKARDIPGLFQPKGKNILAVQDGDQLITMFILVKCVTIPERSFVRSTFDEKNNDWVDFVKEQIQQIVNLKITAKTLYDRLGALIAADIQDKITTLKSPANAKITIDNKSSSNPLVDTGGLRARVTWRVVKQV